MPSSRTPPSAWPASLVASTSTSSSSEPACRAPSSASSDLFPSQLSRIPPALVSLSPLCSRSPLLWRRCPVERRGFNNVLCLQEDSLVSSHPQSPQKRQEISFSARLNRHRRRRNRARDRKYRLRSAAVRRVSAPSSRAHQVGLDLDRAHESLPDAFLDQQTRLPDSALDRGAVHPDLPDVPRGRL